MNRAERNICWYSALFITLVINSARLMALRENGIIARYWQFNILEYGFQFLYNYFFCITLFFLNLSESKSLAGYRQNRKLSKYYFLNGIMILLFIALGTFIQYYLFGEAHKKGILFRGYVARFVLSTIMVAIFIHIVLLIRESKRKDRLNAELKASNLESQLAVLQSQLDPHFLFNSLSSLSGIIRENPPLAQTYVLHLSKIFRNNISTLKADLVSVADELNIAISYSYLIKMRLEDAYELYINVEDEVRNTKIPHLALQTLLENTTKHNMATRKNPLRVRIYTEDKMLVVSNNILPLKLAGESTGTGLANLNGRYLLLMDKSIEIIRTDQLFTVKLPLATT
jgi:two-component system, LytTR family, sensor kinase